MSKQQQNPIDEINRQAVQAMNQIEQSVNEVSSSVAVLQTEADRARGLFGFGRRILVPPDEIHVVVGDGRHTYSASKERKVFGQTADRPSRYWLNALTQVIKLKTISFTVSIRGASDQGVETLDSSRVSFKLWAHAVAKLNPDRAEVAAQRVGLDTTSLIKTITQVGIAALVEAAATMTLEEIIANRHKLAEIAFPKVNQTLEELGYDLALLTVTKLDGLPYQKLIEQAEARISKETSIATNREQLAELQDRQGRERTEAEIKAITEEKLAAEQLEAQEKIETATLNQQEKLDIRRHEVEIQRIERERGQIEAGHQTALARVNLDQQLGEVESEKEAKLAQLKVERDAEVELAESQAEAERLAYEQAREIERAAERTDAEAKRLQAEELAMAQRAKEVALVEANQLAEAMEVEAQAQARSLELKVEAETKTELIKAEAEANATEKRAQAAKIRAEATRAEAAAPGLAEAEVEAAQVEVAEKRVVVTRAEGLAQAEVAQAQAAAEAERIQKLKEVEINAQKELATLYEQAPILVDLEKIRMELKHQERLMAIQTEAHLKAFEAIAPGIQIQVYGNGGQISQIFTNILMLSQGLQQVGEQVPLIGQFVNGNGHGLNWSKNGFGQLLPYIQQVLAEVNPRMYSSLKIADVVDRLGSVVSGQEDLVTALNQLKQDTSFRAVGDLPVGPLLALLGVKVPDKATEESPLEATITAVIPAAES